MVCICLIMWFKTGEEATVGIFSLAVTLLGTIFIAVELKNGQNVTCSDMLIDLNNYFHDSDRLMKVYEALEKRCDNPEDCADVWADVKEVEIMQYCTFFENLFLLYRNEVATIEDLDDLFGYRFFIFLNNPFIQENYILPTSSSFIQIFKLYEVWIKYRKKKDPDWQRHMPFSQFAFSDGYFRQKLYLKDESFSENKAKIVESFIFKPLGFKNTWDVLRLQKSITDVTPCEIYCPLTREELIESLHLDTVTGAYDNNGNLAGVAIIVDNRRSPRNLANDLHVNPEDTLTFDAVFVSPEHRGKGLHRKFLESVIRQAQNKNIKRILTTVSPDNSYSLHNFRQSGFEPVKELQKYGGVTRQILQLTLTTKIYC